MLMSNIAQPRLLALPTSSATASPSGAEMVRLKPKLREQLFLWGAEALSTVDLLAILLGTGSFRQSVRQLAFSLLENGDLNAPCLRDADALRATLGMGDAKAARVLAAIEIGRRAATARFDVDRPRLSSAVDVTHWLGPRLRLLDYEELWLLCLDARNGLKAELQIAKGGALGCALSPLDVLRPAVRNGATALILVHNHPSGDPTPSSDDLRMTRTLARACRFVGLTLLDHVVIARDGATSITDLLGGDLCGGQGSDK